MNRLARVARMPMISYQLSHDAKLTLVMNQIKISKYSKTPFFTYNIQIVVTIQHTHTEKEHEKQGRHDALVAVMKSYESEKTTSSKPDGSTADVNALVLAKILGKA